ncbi:uncharacterized protein LOC111045191 isoform X3 [Nilaparvata lugens]|nr:uncharacterized protein LOC111045191 isoform X3 [Nilaparvata lugens]XP_039282054.1 uncharacterized protein LOC111045191 isoform X3 [Nilaparvata lugens]
MLFIALQPALAVCTSWQHWNFKSRVSAVDNLIFSLGALCLSIDVYMLSEKLRTLINLTSSQYKLYSIGSRVEDDRKQSEIAGDRRFGILEENTLKKYGEDLVQEKVRSLGGTFTSKEHKRTWVNRENDNGTKVGDSNFYYGNHLKEADILEEKTEDFYGRNRHIEVVEMYHGETKLFEQKDGREDEIINSETREYFNEKGKVSAYFNSVERSKANRMSIRNHVSCNFKIGPTNEEKLGDMEGSRFGMNSGKNVHSDYFLKKKQKLIEKVSLEGCRRAGTTANVITSFFSSFTLIPLSGILFYFLRLESVGNLPLPFIIYSPFSFSLNITGFFEYFLLASVELFYIYYTAVLATTVHVIQTLSINNLIGEMRLFHLNAQEIDGVFESVLDDVQNELRLRLVVRELAIHHQTIFRKVRDLNYGSDFRIFYANSYICLQIVFGIFIFLKGELILKIKYGLMVITIALLEFIFSENGQRLQDEGEELRQALYQCDWIGKPAWFTKVFQILMIRNNNLPKVGLLNLFTLNRNNVTVVIRGAYSYFSLLNKISS